MTKNFFGVAALAAIATTLCLVAADRAQACAIPLPQPPLWVENAGINGSGNQEFLIGVELAGLFTDVEAGETTCACGLRFSDPLPFGSEVTDAFVAVTNRQTHNKTLVPGFDFDPNENTSNGLGGRFEQSGWFGLATDAFTSIDQPVVGPGEVLKLWYRVEIVEELFESVFGDDVVAGRALFDPDEFFSAGNMEFATGAADSLGNPDFNGPHAVQFFTAVEVPEPASIVLAAALMMGFVGLRRRS